MGRRSRKCFGVRQGHRCEPDLFADPAGRVGICGTATYTPSRTSCGLAVRCRSHRDRHRNAPDRLFEVINRICQQASKPWLRGNLEASSIELGPFIYQALPPASPVCSCAAAAQIRWRSSTNSTTPRAQSEDRTGIPPIGESLFGQPSARRSSPAKSSEQSPASPCPRCSTASSRFPRSRVSSVRTACFGYLGVPNVRAAL